MVPASLLSWDATQRSHHDVPFSGMVPRIGRHSLVRPVRARGHGVDHGAGGEVSGEPVCRDHRVQSAIALSGYFFEVEFDPDILQCISVANGALAAAEGWDLPPENYFVGVGLVSVANFNVTNSITGSGVLVSMQFEMLEGARNGQTGDLTFATAELNDLNVDPTPDVPDASVAVLDPVVVSVSTPFAILTPGDQFAVDIKVDAGSNILGYAAELSWDPAVLELAPIPVDDQVESGNLVSSWDPPLRFPQADRVSFGQFSVDFVPIGTGEGSIARVHLRVRDDAPVGLPTFLQLDTPLDNSPQIDAVNGVIPVSVANATIDIVDPDDVPLAAWPLALALAVAAACVAWRAKGKRITN